MRQSKPPVLHKQLATCDICGTEWHKDRLYRTQVDFMRYEGHNYLPTSSYDSDYWTASSTSSGNISIGPSAENCRMSLDNDNNLTTVNGAATFEKIDGDATVTISSGIDCSGWTTGCFSAVVGSYHRSTDQSMNVTMSIIFNGSPVTTITKSWVYKGSKRVYVSAGSSDFMTAVTNGGDSDVDVKITVTGDNTDDKFFVDQMQLEKDVTVPGVFYKTTGSQIVVSTDTASLGTAIVCPECFEYVLPRSTLIGRPRTEISKEPRHIRQKF